ncbi:GNAT family N-acetyltransferase [Paenibacillus sp. BK720]|uniref:GNAT family N-acetyltransferase n=1 Tax=Paenibacillus sp. BK720 TaxID=2587092 RepID=UPI00141E74FA|nr:GNAT family N-acetyltransferase [Paenibacillus sp. BK720]NIK67817.1 ribosomal-protein-alanine N-acetyltransferase [Paenibacillus sp. BK720]
MFPVLETDRLHLREITGGDIADIFACFSNKQVTRYYGQEALERMDQAQALIDYFAAGYAEKRGIRWGIERKGTMGLIGTIGFHLWSPKHRRAEIGYELLPESWRNGYASEAISAVLRYGFRELGLNRIGAVVFTDNVASSRLLAKLGFQQEGILRDYMVQYGKAHDTYIYSLLNHL